MLNPTYYTLKNFKFESGAVLEELKLEYATFGKAKTDSEGNIINGILFIHGWSGNYSSVRRFKPIMGPGKTIDTDKYFIICTTSLGSRGSASPSNSSLGADFPKYTVSDMVNAQYLLLNEKLKVKHLNGVVGTSMGGFQSLQWAVNYPDFMDFIIPIVTSSAVQGRNLANSKLMNSLIQKDPDYKQGRYVENPHDALENANKLQFLFAFSPGYYHKEFANNDELFRAFEEQGQEGRKMDANDVVWRNEASIFYDVQKELPKIKAKALIIGIEGDQFFPPEVDAIPLSKSIENSELFLYKSQLGHLGINEIENAREAIENFLSELYPVETF
ncbi:alpha/beta fold hydrolase [Methanobacterium paludis]|uniref:Homoserine O-acetyltransferase n=1 Tax=Methanobacterium paludis (strain DSM 25820 / JCM 18151 / SWAN1) TaxID=868131 RepID=F6D7V0_METPW|nr:alpha/beta fold hydrolase [Methanobacterium paludis]AEG17788.1 Homoserine O-acetyltransferase [Methanobacterium paludis]